MTESPKKSLSPAQQEIMELLWDREEMAAVEIREILNTKRPVARETVNTLLKRLVDSGWLSFRVIGRTHFYQAAMPRDACVARSVLDIVDTMCGGSPERLMNALLGYRGLTPQEAERIQRMIEQAGSAKPENE